MRRSISAALLAAASALAQRVYPGATVYTFLSPLDGSEVPYSLYQPRTLEPGRRYPLVVGLHGSGSNERLMMRRLFGRGNLPGESDLEASRVIPRLPEVEFLAMCPFARTQNGYSGFIEQDVLESIAEVERRFPVDRDRVYLTGQAEGGGGALRLALRHPGRFAAVAAICPIVPPDVDELVPNAMALPVLLVHGVLDTLVPVEATRRFAGRLREAGALVEYDEVVHGKHNVWDTAYQGARIFTWFGGWFGRFSAAAPGERAEFRTSGYDSAEAGWVRIDALVPGEAAAVSWNRGQIVTQGVDALTLRRLTGVAKIDGQPARVSPDGETSFHKEGQTWRPGRHVPVAGEKRPGLEGPIAAAFAGAHLYVFGADQESAARAASVWMPTVRLAVRSDAQVTEDDRASRHLVLFGNRATNREIAALAGALPMELSAGAADYGLLYVYPRGDHYVVVNSGLAWWTGSAPGRAPWQVTPARDDYVLFKGTAETVVARGRFTREWRLTPQAAAQLEATGAVKVLTRGAPAASTPSSRAVPSTRPGSRSSPRR